MPANFADLTAQIDALSAQAARTVGVEASAKQIITGFSTAITKAVSDALAADDAADQGSIDAAKAAIANVTTQFSASADDLGAAVAANPGPPPPPPPPLP